MKFFFLIVALLGLSPAYGIQTENFVEPQVRIVPSSGEGIRPRTGVLARPFSLDNQIPTIRLDTINPDFQKLRINFSTPVPADPRPFTAEEIMRGGRFEMRNGVEIWCPVLGGLEDQDFLVQTRGLLGRDCIAENPRDLGSYFSRTASRDLRICDCLRDTQDTSMLSLSSAVIVPPADLARERHNENVRRMNAVLEAEQNAMRFQASTLVPPEAEARSGTSFTALYSNRFNPPIASRLPPIQAAIEEAVGPVNPIVFPEPSRELLNGDMPLQPGACIPTKMILTQRQMPTDPEFFNDLEMLPERFDLREWDFDTLKYRFLTLSRNVTTLQEAEQNPEGAMLLRRMDFLQRNPMIRNLFAADESLPNSPQLKQEFFRKMRENLRQGDGRVPYATRFLNHRNLLRDFFLGNAESGNLDQISALTQSGAENIIRPVLQNLPSRISSITSNESPAEIWSRVALSRQIGTGGSPSFLNVTDAFTESPEMFGKYCPQLRFSQFQNQWTVFRDLEERLGNAYSRQAWLNPDVSQMNINVCQNKRRGPQGELTYSQFIERRCAGMRGLECANLKGGELVAEFLRAYPDSDANDSIEVAGLIPFLTNQVAIRNYTDAEQNRISDLSRKQNLTGSIEIQSDLRGLGASSNALKSRQAVVTSSEATLQRPSSEPIRQSPSANLSGPASVPLPAESSAGPIAQPETSEQRVARKEQSLRQGESDAEVLRTELAGLRQALQDERQSPPAERDTNLINDLNARIERMEENLRRQERENGRLEREIAEARRPVDRRPANTESDDQEGPVRSSGGATSGGLPQRSQNETQQQSQSVPVVAGTGNSTGASLGGVPRSIPRQISEGARNLAKYGVSEVAVSGGIIVADPARAIDIQRLRSDAGENIINVPVSVAEFDQLPEPERQRYYDQARSLSGTVIKLTFRDGEAFLVKEGSEITLVPTVEARALRAPAGERRYRLSDMRSELSQ